LERLVLAIGTKELGSAIGHPALELGAGEALVGDDGEPPLTPDTQRPACRNHIIDQSLRDRHIGLTRHRWIRPVDLR